MDKILITPRSFGKYNPSITDTIRDAGYETVINPYGKILTKNQITELIKDCVGVIVGVDPLDAEVLASAKKLRVVSKYGVGTDNIDMEYCRNNDIHVSITPGANADAVADFAFALLCACARKINIIDKKCHNKDWGKIMGLDIHGKTIGILGLGAIGKGVAKRARGFDMKVLAYDIFWNSEYAEKNEIEYALPDVIFEKCDYISLHMPLTNETRNMVNKNAFELMSKDTVLINTARGGLIDENALIDALKTGKIAAAGIDVFEEEPPNNLELYTLDNLIMSSHSAGSTKDASIMMSTMAAENIIQSLLQQ